MVDKRIMKSMSDDLHIAQMMLRDSGVSLLDAARLVLHILDFRPEGKGQGAMSYCFRIVQKSLAQQQLKEVKVRDGFELYFKTKNHLRPASREDIEYLARRLFRVCPQLAEANFCDVSLSDCERWLGECFTTPSQFNKGRMMLHGLFRFAMMREWCDRNVVSLIPKKRIVEQEIKALTLPEAQRLVSVSERKQYATCSAGVALLVWAGLRPAEVRRLHWRDIDLIEKSITVRATCSKTGGVRQVDICGALAAALTQHRKQFTPTNEHPICPTDWGKKWRQIRDTAGFAGRWVQDVLRHTFASYHAKHYKDMSLLQWNMGHRDQSLLRTRYVNLQGISRSDAARYFARCAK